MEQWSYEVGGYWGHRIEWNPTDQFGPPKSEFTVVGWKWRKPRVGDLLEDNFKKGRVRFEFIKVTPTRDPPDMFFATVRFIGYVVDGNDRKEGPIV